MHSTIIGGKLRGLSKRTGQSQAECIGALVLLWLWGLDNAGREGEIKNADVNDVAEVLHGKTAFDPVKFVKAMIQTGWIDRVEGTLYFHDWSTWQKQWYTALKRREQDRARKGGEVCDIPEEPPVEKYPPEFEELWRAYPRKTNKSRGYMRYRARINEGWKHETLMAATVEYSAQCKRKGTQEEFIKHCETFLGPNKPFRDYLPKRLEEDDAFVEPTANPYAKYKED